jgi:hypothetical protein
MEIGKGRRRNDLRLNPERFQWLSCDDFREKEGGSRTKEKMGERV